MAEHVLRTETRQLPVKLTEGEILERSRRAAEQLGQAERQQEQLETWKKSRKAEIDELEDDARRLLSGVRRGQEDRDVEVEIVADYGAGIVKFVRKDTGEEFFTRALTTEEKQISLLPKGKRQRAAQEADAGA